MRGPPLDRERQPGRSTRVATAKNQESLVSMAAAAELSGAVKRLPNPLIDQRVGSGRQIVVLSANWACVVRSTGTA